MGLSRLFIVTSALLAQLLVCVGAQTNSTHIVLNTTSDDYTQEPEAFRRKYLRYPSPSDNLLHERSLKKKNKGKGRTSKGGKGKGKDKEGLCYPGPGEVFISQIGKPFDGDGFEYIQFYFPTCKGKVVAGVHLYIITDDDDGDDDEGNNRVLREHRKRWKKLPIMGPVQNDGTKLTCTNGASRCDVKTTRALGELEPTDNFVEGFFVDGTAQFSLCPEGRKGKGKGKGKSKGKGSVKGDDEVICEGGDTYGDGSEEADFTGGFVVRRRDSIPDKFEYVPPKCPDDRKLKFLSSTCGRKLTGKQKKGDYNHPSLRQSDRSLEMYDEFPGWEAESWVIRRQETVENVPDLTGCNRWPEYTCTCPPTKPPSTTSPTQFPSSIGTTTTTGPPTTTAY